MTPARTGKGVGLAARHAVADALYPGELARHLEGAGRFIGDVLNRYGSRWVSRLGRDVAFAEAQYGALKGLVGWLLNGGPEGTAHTANTYIVRGIFYHFGTHFPWYVGPIRINIDEYTRDPDACPVQIVPDESDGVPWDEAEVFGVEDDGPAAVDDADRFGTLGAIVLAAADAADRSGQFREVLDLRHGITSGRPLSFRVVGVKMKMTKQGAHATYLRALAAVRPAVRGADTR